MNASGEYRLHRQANPHTPPFPRNGDHQQLTPPLTAGQALTFDEIAGIATDVTGHTVTRITAPDNKFREQLADRGVPAEAADQLLGSFAASRAGEFAAVDPTLATLLGREPTALGTVLREHQTPIRTR